MTIGVRRATSVICGLALMIGGGVTGCGKSTGTETPKVSSALPSGKPEAPAFMGANAESEK